MDIATVNTFAIRIAKKTLDDIIENCQDKDVIKLVNKKLAMEALIDLIEGFFDRKYEDMKKYPASFAQYIELSSITMVCMFVRNVTKTLSFGDQLALAKLSHSAMALFTMENTILYSFGGYLPTYVPIEYRHFHSLDERLQQSFRHVPKIFYIDEKRFIASMNSLYDDIRNAEKTSDKINILFKIYILINDASKHLNINKWGKFYKVAHEQFPRLWKDLNKLENPSPIDVHNLELLCELVKRDIPNGDK